MTNTHSELEPGSFPKPAKLPERTTELPGEQPVNPQLQGKKTSRFTVAQPVLEKLYELYPALFGQRFVPLKLGVFQDLLVAHPDVFQRDSLKLALSVHTRSTRYLQSVAAGQPRHDLQGCPVQTMAPEHIFMAIVEVFTRRQAKTAEDLLPKLQNQLVAAYEKSGLQRADYLACIGSPEASISAVLDQAIQQVEQQRARHAALAQAFAASGKPVQEFADMFGMSVQAVKAALQATPPDRVAA